MVLTKGGNLYSPKKHFATILSRSSQRLKINLSTSVFSMQLNHHLKVEPYEYQKEGICFGLENKSVIIGDEPGLGKTLQSIGIVDTANAYPCLVICPSSLKINWQREFEKFTDKSALVLDNNVRTTWGYLLSMGVHQVAIVNYESLRKYFVWDIKAGKQFRLKDVVFCPQVIISSVGYKICSNLSS